MSAEPVDWSGELAEADLSVMWRTRPGRPGRPGRPRVAAPPSGGPDSPFGGPVNSQPLLEVEGGEGPIEGVEGRIASMAAALAAQPRAAPAADPAPGGVPAETPDPDSLRPDQPGEQSSLRDSVDVFGRHQRSDQQPKPAPS